MIGVKKVEGVTVDIYQVAETLNDEILGKMHAPPKVYFLFFAASTSFLLAIYHCSFRLSF